MIDWLEIKQFVIAEHIELEFDRKFTTVTGETGSGKSLIVDAIGILLGHRSDNSYIRHGHDTAELQVSFALDESHPSHHWMKHHGMNNDQECILRRVIRRDKSSKGYINGHAVTVSQLREIGRDLVDIHGQNEHHSLLKKLVQQNLLDHAADNLALVSQLETVYQNLRKIQQKIELLNSQSQASQERADLLKFQIEELNELAPQPDEWLNLENDHKRMHHQHELATGARSVADILYSSENESTRQTVNDQLVQSAQQLSQLAEFDDGLNPLVVMLNEAQLNIEEVAGQLRPFYGENEIDPLEIARIEHRFSLYHNLARKHRLLPQLLVDHLESMKQELSALKEPEHALSALQNSLFEESENYNQFADQISLNRHRCADKLAIQVTQLMQELGMSGGKFDIQLRPSQSGNFNRYGNESVEFVVAANPGQPLQSLGKVASGGELSRISLAIQVIIANKAQVPTLIFDEVDVGIGGEVANVVGQKLKQLGQANQVLCITHLSQVAAKGDHHFSVSKTSGNQVEARVVKLDKQQRVEEIARMTSGEKLTSQSIAHAEEMLKSA
jgi:DNA repair protein RecN (Recombination protein N)